MIETSLSNIDAIFEDSNGYIWLAAENGIGFIDTDGGFHLIGNPNGVGFYSGIWQDYHKGYWITATRGGIVNFALSAFTDCNTFVQFETGSPNAILTHHQYTYIGTDNGLFVVDGNGSPALPHLTELVTGRVRAVSLDSAGNIWISTFSELGLLRYTPSSNELRNWTDEDGLLTERVRFVYELPTGVIAVGTAIGANFIIGDEVVSPHEALGIDPSVAFSIPEIAVLTMAYADNSLFLGTDGNGVYRISENGTARFSEEDGLPGGVVLRMLVDSDGVWVAAAPGLSFITNDGLVTRIGKVPPYSFFDLLMYEDDLIMITSEAIIRTNADALRDPNAPFVFSSVGRANGLDSIITANSWNILQPDGTLYFCTHNGVRIYNFESEAETTISFAGVGKIDADGTEYRNFTETIRVPGDTNRITFELSLLSFGLADDSVLFYQLVGQDPEPIMLSLSDNHNISFTNLRGGYYTLRVWTQNSRGETGNIIEIEIFKELSFFEQPHVWLILILLFLALFVMATISIIRVRTRKLNAKQQEYRTIISQALTAIANTIDAKDHYTSGHSVRVAAYSVEIARRMGMSQDFLENLYYIALLHDVGKIGIPDGIINKPARLTKDEFDIIKQHPEIGKNILKEISTINNLTAGTAEHHERWDGMGYMSNLSGESISLEARIIAIADTYDAMSSDRSYRKGMSKEEILNEFKRCSGKQFDPEIAEIAIEMIEQDYFDSIDVNSIIGILNKEAVEVI